MFRTYGHGKVPFLLLILLIPFQNPAQVNKSQIKFMFYNVENLFDIYDDTLTSDNEFLPGGAYHWNKNRYHKKINQIYKVILAIGQWDPPALIGLCEVENQKVLTDLVYYTPFVKYNYQFIHYNSPDLRGIDVALLYNPGIFKPIYHCPVPVHFPGNPDLKTRDILYVKGLVKNSDTLHIFVNHWPSRWGGQTETEGLRINAATILKSKTDSIFQHYPQANIIITGDFNDYYNNKSISSILGAQTDFSDTIYHHLYNLTTGMQPTGKGSHKYEGVWGCLDQFIVSGNLLDSNKNIYTSSVDFSIFSAGFLLETDEPHFGFKPYRTYTGYKYNGGFSDHLPVFINLWLKR